MFKELFICSITESMNSDDMTFKIELMKEIKRKLKLKKFPVYMGEDDMKPDVSYDRNSPNGKIRVHIDTKTYDSPVYNFEYV